MLLYLELAVIWFVVATLIYLALSVYARSVRRERLEKEFDATFPPGSGDVAADRDAYIADGLAEHGYRLRQRLIGLVYVLPVVAFAAVIYLVHYR
jgi:hypothetical protein